MIPLKVRCISFLAGLRFQITVALLYTIKRCFVNQYFYNFNAIICLSNAVRAEGKGERVLLTTPCRNEMASP